MDHPHAPLTPDAATAAAQPVGPPVPEWQPRPYPERRSFAGRYCRIQPLDPAAHATPLYEALCDPANDALWTYLLTNPPGTPDEWRQRLESYAASRDPLYFALFNEQGCAAGITSYLRIVPEHGVVEVGHIHLSPSLQQTRAATEFQYLLMRHAFEDLGYRRYEWKCDALNAPSRRAAERFGFTFEGLFRRAVINKGRTRDTAWYAMIEEEWPALEAAYPRTDFLWLDTEASDAEGFWIGAASL